MSHHNLYNLASNYYIISVFVTLPANMLCRHSCGAEALHAVVVDEARLFEG